MFQVEVEKLRCGWTGSRIHRCRQNAFDSTGRASLLLQSAALQAVPSTKRPLCLELKLTMNVVVAPLVRVELSLPNQTAQKPSCPEILRNS